MKPDRQTTIVFIVVGSLLLAAILYGFFGPKANNWQETYETTKKRPFDTYVLLQELPSLFPDTEIQASDSNIIDRFAFESYENNAFVFIHDYLPLINYEAEELLRFASEGNEVFLAGESIPYELKDTMGINVGGWLSDSLLEQEEYDTIEMRMINPTFPQQTFPFLQKRAQYTIVIAPEHDTEPLLENQYGDVYAVRTRIGEGAIVYCSLPHAFTNYQLVQTGNDDLATHLLSYLSEPEELWYHTQSLASMVARNARNNSSGSGNGSRNSRNKRQGLFGYIFSREALAWAFWLVLGGMILFALFEIKRTQRIIPIIKPLPNTTLDFTETVGRLYFQSRDHKAVATKKIKIFLGFIRSHYYLKTNTFSKEFISTLAGKSGMSEDDIRILCKKISSIRNQGDLTEEELLELNARIEHFYRQASK